MEMDNATKSHILQIQEAARQNRLVVFVGAGVSASAGVPAWRELVEKFKSEVPDNMFDENDVLKTAQIYREQRGEVEYQKQIKKFLKYGQTSCNQIHKAIMDLNPCHIVTTNYDDLLEQSALQNNKQYYVVAKDAHLPANQGERMLVKMHGDFKEGNIVLTENDYFDYSRTFPLIRAFLLSLFSTKVVLFIGFSFNDINLKYILREVSSILESKMQRVYMLVDEKESPLAYSYFLRKGIQLLNIPSSMSDSVLKEQKIEYDVDGLAHEKSKSLYKSLVLIRNYDSTNNDLIDLTFDFLKKYEDQLRFWGVYLKYALPEKTRKGFSISQNELKLPENHKEWFEKNIIEASQKILENKYGTKIGWLIEKLYDNRVTSISGHSIYEKERADEYNKHNERITINLIYSLSVTDIESREKELRARSNDFTIVDLELPYILFKRGRYREAYSIYRELAPEFWSRRKYILYFIASYNAKALYEKVIMEKISERGFDYSAFQKEIDELKFREKLEELPLDNSIKEMMRKIVDGRMLMEDWIEASRLNENILEQRKNAERGGLSLNSNIANLLDKFEQNFFFCNKNYILNECYKYSTDAYKMMIRGILNSVMTPDENGYSQSKLDKLLASNMMLFVFMVDSGELRKILNDTVTKLIPAEDDFIDGLGLIIDNIVKDLEKNRNKDYMSQDVVANYVKNIILLLNRLEQSICVPGIYKVIEHYWYKGRFVEFEDEMISIYHKQTPTSEEALHILECALHSRTLQHPGRIAEFISHMAEEAGKGGKFLDEIVCIKQLNSIEDIQLRSAFLLALREDVRNGMIDHIRSNVDNLYDLCFIEIYSNLHIINGELIDKLKDSITKHDYNEDSYTEEVTCSLLHQMSENGEYPELKESLENFSKTCECYRFLSNPRDYDKPELVTGKWLRQLKDDELSKLLENKEMRKVAIKYCDKSHFNSGFKKRVWSLLGGKN